MKRLIRKPIVEVEHDFAIIHLLGILNNSDVISLDYDKTLANKIVNIFSTTNFKL